MPRVLLTTTSYQDTPGEHHRLLESSGFEVVRARGPLNEQQMLELIASEGPFDATLNGDDAFTPAVIDALLPQIRCIAKYGIGLDSIDVNYATSKKLPVLFTPGVNHTTVAEHAFGLMIAVAKHFVPHLRAAKAGQWKRTTGNELAGKTLGVLGMGRIGKEVIKRAAAFDMKTIAFDLYWDGAFAWKYKVQRGQSVEEVTQAADVLSLHMNLDDTNRHFLNAQQIAAMRDNAIIINTARGGLVDENAIADACRSGKLGGYGTDVLEHEPMQTPHPFQDVDNIVVTPHVASRTFESVERQAVRATKNVVNFLKGESDFIQANKF
ncbi:MAG: phosphoglycerate dehydrogenase [Phycisphaeraceae bacterium]